MYCWGNLCCQKQNITIAIYSQYNPHRVLFCPLLYTIIFIDTVYVLKNSVVWSKEVYVEVLNTAENVGNEPA